MTKDYRRLWKGVTGTTNEGNAVRISAEVLADGEAGLLSRV